MEKSKDPGKLGIFLQQISNSIDKNDFIKISLGNKRDKQSDLANIFVKPVLVKNRQLFSFVYRYTTNDITKNLGKPEAIELIGEMLQTKFLNADLFTSMNDFHFTINENNGIKIVTRPASLQLKENSMLHDKVKQRIITTKGNIYLQQLGILSAEGVVKKDMQHKYKQINRYVEIIDGIIKDLKLDKDITVMDMGSGKGYLTFALYDYLTSKIQLSHVITGIELRDELVSKCNSIAEEANFKNLHFEKGDIANAHITKVDILIALHACDTATDDAIYKGIHANATVILCAPCCHKQVRKQIAPENALSSITKHGILMERQAEILTDTIRALLLEINGYKTQVFEFIGTEHTPKNVMIAATKSMVPEERKILLKNKIAALKKLFGIKEHYLEKLLIENNLIY